MPSTSRALTEEIDEMGQLTSAVKRKTRVTKELAAKLNAVWEKLVARDAQIQTRIAELEAARPELLASHFMGEAPREEVDALQAEISRLRLELEEIGLAVPVLRQRDRAAVIGSSEKQEARYLRDAAAAEERLAEGLRENNALKIGLARSLARAAGCGEEFDRLAAEGQPLDPPDAA